MELQHKLRKESSKVSTKSVIWDSVGAHRMNWKSSKLSFLTRRALFLSPPLRVVYLCNKLPEGVRGMLNLYEPDSLTWQQNSCKNKNIHTIARIDADNAPKLIWGVNNLSWLHQTLLLLWIFIYREANSKSKRMWEDSDLVSGETNTELKVWAVSIKFKFSMQVTDTHISLRPSSFLLSVKSSLCLIWK